MLAIDGRRTLPQTDEPARLIGKDMTSLMVAGRPVHVEIEGFGLYEPVRRMFWDALRAQGSSSSCRPPVQAYSVRGSIAPEASSVWIEDDATHQAVGRRIVVPGRAASGAATGRADPCAQEARKAGVPPVTLRRVGQRRLARIGGRLALW